MGLLDKLYVSCDDAIDFVNVSRDKLEPLGVDTELDKSKLVQSRKPSEKKAVKKAYEEAILHR